MDPAGHLNQWQLDTLERLVSIPSPSLSEQEVMRYIRTSFEKYNRDAEEGQECRCIPIPVESNLENLIVQKGRGDLFTLLMYAHVDTVERDENWENAHALQRDADGRLHGVGVYDNKSGVMAVMDVLHHVPVSDEMQVIGVFGVDEERNSTGAESICESETVQRIAPDRCLLLSPEIASLDEGDCDAPKDVVIGRCGSLKTTVTVTTPGGHRFRSNAPNAITAKRELVCHLFEHFGAANDPFGFEEEKLQETDECAAGNKYSMTPSRATLGLEHFLVGHNVDQALLWQRTCAARLAQEQRWARQGIEYTIGQTADKRSYEPYLSDVQNPLVRMALAGVDAIYGSHRLVRGRSPADTCVFAQRLSQRFGVPVPILELGPVGGDPHQGTEWMQEASVARMCQFYKYLVHLHIPQFLRQH